MSKDARNDALKKAWRAQEEKKLTDSIPIPHTDLKELFDYLDRENPPPCDHTLRETTAGSVAPRALVRVTELKPQTANRNAARVAPAPAVAHL